MQFSNVFKDINDIELQLNECERVGNNGGGSDKRIGGEDAVSVGVNKVIVSFCDFRTRNLGTDEDWRNEGIRGDGGLVSQKALCSVDAERFLMKGTDEFPQVRCKEGETHSWADARSLENDPGNPCWTTQP